MERFFIKDLTEELTQRNLKSSSRVNATPQSDIIRNLERENLYLKNQLFALIQNSGVYDMYLPSEALLCDSYIKNGRTFSSPAHWTKNTDINTNKNQSSRNDSSPRRQCLSPRVQSNNNPNQAQQLNRARSPEIGNEFCRNFLLSPGHISRQSNQSKGYDQGLNLIRSQNNSPSRVTPKQSLIFTTQPSQQRLKYGKPNIRDMNTCSQAKEMVNKLKRNAKSPSFLKNRQAFKENVRESLSNIMKDYQNHNSTQKNKSNQPCEVNNNFVQVEPQNKLLTANNQRSEQNQSGHHRSKSKTFSAQFSDGDSCLSIERRLKEILYDSMPNSQKKQKQ